MDNSNQASTRYTITAKVGLANWSRESHVVVHPRVGASRPSPTGEESHYHAVKRVLQSNFDCPPYGKLGTRSSNPKYSACGVDGNAKKSTLWSWLCAQTSPLQYERSELKDALRV